MEPLLHVIMYHYVRDLPHTRFPKIKGILLDEFNTQVRQLEQRYEMAGLESALAFLQGRYVPSRPLCLLTFDDGLKEHFVDVTPILAERRVQGVFSVITSCLEERRVTPVHMNHFLMASLSFDCYRSELLAEVRNQNGHGEITLAVDPAMAQRSYPWDTADIASFKYLLNFIIDTELRDSVVSTLFQRHLGNEADFARELYVSWEEARAMQDAGMIVGGHSHRHRSLAQMPEQELGDDLGTCRELLHRRLRPQPYWPFCYPFGKKHSFSEAVTLEVMRLGFCCAFSTEPGCMLPGPHSFEIKRIDCKHDAVRSAAA